ncbi:MAG: TolC family protein [Burkholderiales bacterium]
MNTQHWEEPMQSTRFIGARPAWFVLILAALIPFATLGQIGGSSPLTLDEAVARGLARSLKVGSQSQAVEAATETVARAGELPDPKLRFGLENLPVTDADRFRYNRDFMTMQRIGVMQEFPHGDKRSAARTRAQSEVVAERAGLARERAAVRRETALAWIEYAYAQVLRTRFGELDSQIGFEVEASVPALAVGRATAAEVFALRGVREALRDRQIAQDRIVQRARIDLARLIGAAGSGTLGPIPDASALPRSETQIAQWLLQHPAVVTALAQTRVVQADVQRARATKAPDWAVELSFARREPSFSNMVSLMFQLDLPLWAERRQDRDIAARVASLERARTMVDDARRSAEAELHLFLADHEAAHRRIAHHRHGLLPTARQRTGAATAAYQGGKGTLAGVLESRRAEAEIEIDTLGAERERALAWANLRYALLDEDERAGVEREDQK